MSRFSWISSIVLVLSLFSRSTDAFVEEACFFPGDLTALYQTAIDLQCKVDSNRPLCVAASMASGNDTFGATWCRGFLHFDAIYFMAQALGFTGEAAYWIATSSVSIDFVQFTATDSCGNTMPDSYQPAPMRGMLRTSTITGSHLRHLGILYKVDRPKTNGLYPNTQSYSSEGMLAQARDWAWGNSNLLCTCGFTYPDKDGNMFHGKKCLDDGSFINNTISPPELSYIIKGPIPTAPANTTLGDQIIHYNCQGDPNCDLPTPENMIDIVTAPNMYTYVQSTPFAKSWTTNQTIPELWIRLGIYLHQLADRNSHYYMADPKATAIVREPKNPKVFKVLWDPAEANFIHHSVEHQSEQMLKPGLPAQSIAILNNYYTELAAFKQRFANRPDSKWWFNKKYTPLSKAQLVGNSNKKGLMVTLAEMPNIVERMICYMDELRKYGYKLIPGQEKRCPTWKRAKTEL